MPAWITCWLLPFDLKSSLAAAPDHTRTADGCSSVARAPLYGGTHCFGKGPLRVVTAVALSVVLVCAPARANDSSAELATGGLVFVHNPDVEMRAEELFVSAAEIRVRYRFLNEAQHDVTTLVAFPLPEIPSVDVDIYRAGQLIIFPTEDPENIVGFSTLADGHPVVANVDQRARAAGIDHTEKLRALGIPLVPERAGQALERLPAPTRHELTQAGLVEIREEDGKEHVVPCWALQTTYYWKQTFPAQHELVIEHRYKPIVGTSSVTLLGTESDREDVSDPHLSEQYRLYRRRYCIDQNLLRTLERMRRAAPKDSPFEMPEQRIEYILRTGANWAGPIRDFRLVVDKGKPENLVSFCGDGVKKIGPTQFEMRKRDFTPEGNLHVLILKRGGVPGAP